MRTLFILLGLFLIIEHIYVKYGSDLINYIASKIVQEEVKIIEEKEEDRKSLIEMAYERIKNVIEEVREWRSSNSTQ